MKSLLLAAGLGTRLRPYTDSCPKCLMNVGGRSLLSIWLNRLDSVDCLPVCVNTHYLAGQVEDFVETSPYRSKIKLSHERSLLGTAATARVNRGFFGTGDGLIIHADNYCEADLARLIRAHRARPEGCVMTMLTFDSNEPNHCGIVQRDERGVLVAFHEKVENPPGKEANAAVYVVSQAFFDLLESELSFAKDISLDVIPHLLGRAFLHHTDAPVVDIGTVERLHAASELARSAYKCPSGGGKLGNKLSDGLG